MTAERPQVFTGATIGAINGHPAIADYDPDTGILTLSYTFPATASAPVAGPDFDGAIGAIEGAPAGGTVTLDMRGQTTLPARVFEALAGRDVTLILLMDGGLQWEINGLNVPKGLPGFDFGALPGGKSIPQAAIDALAGGARTLQLHLNHDGPFGFKARLRLPVQPALAGFWGLLYFWQGEAFDFRAAAQVKLDTATGKAYIAFDFDHASDYLIVFSQQAPQAPKIKTASLPEGNEGEKYAVALKAQGLVNEWSLASGQLPPGLKLKDGEITGIPSEAGRYAFKLRAQGPMGADEKRLVLVIEPGRMELSADYLLLSAGESAQLALAEDRYAHLPVAWRAEGEAISVDGNGVVTAVKRGLGYAVAEVDLGEGKTLEGRCRVDVIEEGASREVQGAVLGRESVTVKLYAQEAARLTLSLTLKQNAMAKSAQPQGAIRAARFSDDDADRRFEFRVVDDNTLEILPRAQAGQAKGSYKSKITLTLADGGEIETEKKLTVKVDSSLPKVTGALAFNTFYDQPAKTLRLEGGQVLSAEVISCPQGLTFDPQTMEARLTGALKKKDKLVLRLTLAGWSQPVEASIPITAKKSAPQLTLSPDTLALDQGDTVAIAPAELVTAVKVVSWEELSAKQKKTYKLNAGEYGFTAALEGGRIRIGAQKAASGKLLLAATVEGAKESVHVALTIKEAGEGKLTVKTKESIDLLRPDSFVALTPSVAEWQSVQLTVSARDKKKKGEKAQLGDQTSLFEVEEEDGRLLVRRAAGAKLNPQYAYTATLTLKTQAGPLTAETAIAVKKGKATPRLSDKAVTLFTGDRYSEAIVEVSFKDKTLSPIEKVESASKKFTLEYLGGGRCAIRFKGEKAPKKGETMKLKIYLEGYDKPAATAKVKVKLAD